MKASPVRRIADAGCDYAAGVVGGGSVVFLLIHLVPGDPDCADAGRWSDGCGYCWAAAMRMGWMLPLGNAVCAVLERVAAWGPGAVAAAA